MKKKVIAVYGNGNHTIDIAALFAIGCAAENIKTMLIELGEGTNPKLSYKLGIEDQRIRTLDYYLENMQKGVSVNTCILSNKDICGILTDREKSLLSLIKKLPDSLSILPRKTPSDDPMLSEDEYKKAIETIRSEGLENNDMVVIALSGNAYSYPVFFSLVHADESIFVTGDMPEDIRSLSKLAVDMKNIMPDFKLTSLYLDYGSEISIENFEKTALNVKYTLPLKAILKLRALSGRVYDGEAPEEINRMVKEIGFDEIKEEVKGIFGKKKIARKEK